MAKTQNERWDALPAVYRGIDVDSVRAAYQHPWIVRLYDITSLFKKTEEIKNELADTLNMLAEHFEAKK